MVRGVRLLVNSVVGRDVGKTVCLPVVERSK